MVPRYLDVTTVYNELMNTVPGRTVETAKSLLQALSSSLLRDKPRLNQTPLSLLEKPIFPVRFPNGDVKLCPWDKTFVIVDRKHLGGIFRDKVNTLGFNVQEVHQLEPFIRWAGLSIGYISYMVSEAVTLNPGEDRRVSEQRFDIRRMAHGLIRYVITTLCLRDPINQNHANVEAEWHRISKAREFKATGNHYTTYYEIHRRGRRTGCPPCLPSTLISPPR